MKPLTEIVANLKHWLRHTWIARLPLLDRFLGVERPAPAPKRKQRTAQPQVEVFEDRNLTNDPFGLAQGAIFGGIAAEMAATFRTPTQALMRGLSPDWSGVPGRNGDNDSPDRPAVIPSADADAAFANLRIDSAGAAEDRPNSGAIIDAPVHEPTPPAPRDDRLALNNPIGPDFLDRVLKGLNAADPALESSADGEQAGGGGGGGGTSAGAGGMADAGAFGGGGGPGSSVESSLSTQGSFGGGPGDSDPFASLPADFFGGGNSSPAATALLGQAGDAASVSPATPDSPYIPWPLHTEPAEPFVPGTLAPDALATLDAPAIRFEANRGQDPSSSPFLVRGAGFGASLSAGGVSFHLPPKADAASQAPVQVSMHFDGANSKATLAGQQLLPDASNYYLGDDPSQWLSAVPNYAGVIAQNVYDGINVVYHSTGTKLEYDLQLAPGADVSQVHIAFDGADGVALDGKGGLLIHTAAGDLVEQGPALFQQLGNQQVSVAGSFALNQDGTVGFVAGAHDAARPLLIDPVIGFSGPVSLGSLLPTAITRDSSGNLYVAGQYNSGTSLDAFVRKLSSTGATVFTSYYGGSGSETAPAIVVDASGQASITGRTNSTNLATLNPYQASNAGGDDAFLASFSASGTLTMGSYFGGANNDAGRAIAIDSTGRLIVVGETSSSNLPLASAFQSSNGGGKDAFVTRFAVGAGSLSLSSYDGGNGDDTAAAVVVDSSDNIVFAGTTASNNLATTATALQRHFAGGSSDGFVVKVLASSNSVGLASYFGGEATDTLTALALDSENSIYLTGATQSDYLWTRNPLQGVGQAQHATYTDAYAAKLNAGASDVFYSTFLGGSTSQGGKAIGVDSNGQAIVGLGTASMDFPVFNGLASPYGGFSMGNNAALVRLDSEGHRDLSSTLLGGTSIGVLTGLAVDGGGTAYVAGTDGGGSTGTVIKVDPKLDSSASPLLLGITSDTGSSAFDNLTTSTSPTLRGIAAPSSSVKVLNPDGTSAGTATADSNGLWTLGLSGLSEGTHAYTVIKNALEGINNLPSPPLLVTVDQTAPSLTLIAAASTSNTRPVVQLRVSDRSGLLNGTLASLDIDLNNDGSFLDAGESGAVTAPLLFGLATFTLPQLSTGTIGVRGRLTDRAGNEGTSSTVALQVIATASPWQMTATALTYDPGEGDPLSQLGDASYAIPLDLDQSPGTGVGGDPQLVYHGSSANVQPVIQATLSSDNSLALPSLLRVVLTWDGVAQTEQDFATAGFAPGQDLTVAVRPTSAVTTTGRHTWSLQVTADYAGLSTNAVETASGSTFVVSLDASVFGPGWSFSETDRLVTIAASGSDPAGQLMVLGSGGARFYKQVGSGSDYRYLAADGFEDTASPRAFGTLTHETDNSWTFTTADGTVEKFDSSGNQTKRITADGFAVTTFTYASGNLSGMATPDGALTTFTLASGKVATINTGARAVTLSYSGGGDLTSVSRPGPIGAGLSYDGNHRLTQASESGNQLGARWAYSNGLASSLGSGLGEPNTWLTPVASEGLGSLFGGPVRAVVEDAAGRYQYTTLDSLARPIQQQFADGSTTSTARSSAGWISTTTDSLGRVTAITRDAQGYVTGQTNPDGSTRSNSYQTAFHALTSSTDERGNSTTYAYDSLGHPTGMTDALGQNTSQAWSSGLLSSSTDGRNLTTTYGYDSSRRPIRETDPLGTYRAQTYDSNGNLATDRNTLGFVTTYANDAAGRVTMRTNALGGVASWSYLGNSSLLDHSTDEAGTITTYTYDTRGAVISRAQSTLIQRTAHDLLGRVVGQQSSSLPVEAPWGRFSEVEYDALDRPSATTDAAGNQKRYLYDNGDRPIASRDELGRWSFTGYDANRDWPTTQTDPLGYTTTFGHDAAGNQTSVTNPLGVSTSMVLDALNRVVGTIEAAGTSLARTSTVAFDAAGNLSSKTDALGIRTDYGYDSRNALATMTEGANTATPRTTTMVSDAAGHVIDQTGPLGLRTTFAYDALGRMTATSDNAGSSPMRTTTFAYDAVGNRKLTVDALGYYTSATYNGLGQITYSSEGQNSTVVRALNSSYENSGLLAAQMYLSTINGVTQYYPVTYGYDALGQQSSTQEPGDSSSAGRTVQSVRDAVGNVVLVLGPRPNQESRNDYDADGRLLRQWQLLDSTTGTERENQLSYDAAGNQITFTDPLGRVTTNVFDTLRRKVVVQEPLSKTTTTTLDAGDRVLSVTNSLGQVISYAYDVYNRRTQAIQNYGTSSARTVASVTYDLLGKVTSQTDALNRTATFSYDVLQRLVSSVDSAGQTTTYTTDILGRVTEVTDPLGRKIDTAYDAGNRPYLTITNAQLPSGQQTTRTTLFDWRGQPLVVMLNGVSRASYTYNFWGQAETISDSNGYLELHYDEAGNIIGTRDSGGLSANYITYTYDLVNRRTQAQVYVATQTGVAASLVAATYAYDAAGELTSTTDRNGRRRDITYDSLGRATQERWYDNTGAIVGTITTTRDLLDGVLTITDPSGTLTFSYDQYNRQQSSTDVFGVTLTNTYNNADERTVLTDSFGGVATWTHDTTSGRLTQLQVLDGSGTAAQIDYDFNNDSEVSRRTCTGAGTTITTDTGYDGAGRATTIVVYSAQRNIETLTYVYDVTTGLLSGASRTAWRTAADPSLNLFSVSNPTFTYAVSMVYDSHGQITSFGSQAYTYDGNGNLTPSGTQLGAGNRLLQDGTWKYQYDLEGNLIQKTKQTGSDIWNYSYDPLNRLIEAKETTVYSGTTYTLNDVSYRYDALGRRVESVTQSWTLTTGSTVTYAQNATVTLRFSYDGQTLLFDLSGSNAEQVRFVQDAAGGQMLARIATSGSLALLWYVSDKDGAVIDILDPAGRAIKRLKQGGFKVENTYLATTEQIGWVFNRDGTWTAVDWTPPATLSDRFGYGGQELDAATGLLYSGLRWYAQELARSISEQPGALDGTNAYRFPYNSPGNLVAVDATARVTPWGLVGRMLGISALIGEQAWNNAGDFLAGVSDRLTAGLTARVRRWLDIDEVDYGSQAYQAGEYVGQAAGIALNFVSPFGLAGLVNTLAATGGAINGVEALSEGRVWDATMAFGGAMLAKMRGLSSCRLATGVLKTAEYGLHAFGAIAQLASAWEKYQNDDVLGGLLDLAEAGANAYRYLQSCFAAGTPLLWEYGSKGIEKFAVGERVWSRDEFDPYGPLVLKVIEEVFVRTAKILHVHVRDQVIRTTAEHPCFVKRAWDFVPAGELQTGDLLLSHDGQWVAVEEVYDTGEYETVYNLRVADFHTYFVGDTSWGFSVWAHNADNCGGTGDLSAKRRAAAQARWAKHRAAQAAGQRGTPAGRGPAHTARQREIRQAAGGRMEQDVVLNNGQVRTADVIDAQGRIHQVGDMRTRGGFRPSGRERAAIEDIRKAVGPDRTIIFHDKNGRLPSLINPDLQPGWRPAPGWRRMDP